MPFGRSSEFAKRCFDLLIAGVGLVLLSPLIVILAVCVVIDSPGPALFRQRRIGRGGTEFVILKFRTMVVGADRVGPAITVGRDSRVTRLGRFLRASKLDELPQLWNVMKGDMSTVGPRPEVAKYVALYPPGARERVLSVRPGITDQASIAFAHESDLLDHAADPEQYYANEILPRKLAMYESYVAGRSLWGDFRIILATIARLYTRRGKR